MDIPYRLEKGTVTKDGRSTFTYAEVEKIARLAVRRALRADIEELLPLLKQGEEIGYTWNFLWWTHHVDYYQSTMCIRQAVPGEDLFCISLSAATDDEPDYILRRIAELIHQENLRFMPKAAAAQSRKYRKGKSRRAQKRRAQLLKKLAVRALQPVQQKKERARTHSPLSTRGKQKVSLQFKKQEVLWDEALKAVTAIFDIASDGVSSKRDIAKRRLFRSLEHSGGRFAAYRQHGFTLQFELRDSRWRGDLTLCAVWATKKRWVSDDPARKLYRRMRAHFRRLLVHPEPERQAARMRRIQVAHSLPPNTVVIDGVRYRNVA